MPTVPAKRARAVGLALLAFSPLAAHAAAPTPPAWALRGTYAPKIDPANFGSTVDNPYFPLKPGTAFHFRGVVDGAPQTDDAFVTRQAKVVAGVRCTVVRDTVSQNGKPLELTFDWYAQDKQGNVWYMGEDSRELKNGRFVKAGDSWETGADGARPGIVMKARPRRGDVYRQEYYPAHGALDQARVQGLSGPLHVPAGTYPRVLQTLEWSPSDPQFERKDYAAGIGEVKERVTQGGHEEFTLVTVTHKG